MNNNDNVYLKLNVVIEPLFDRWYAWSHLISPATCAMNITGRHLKIMNSYIQAPQIHEAAVKNPKMLGGPFMDLGGSRVDDIRKLKEYTLEKQRNKLEFSKAIKELDEMLKTHAQGYSLEPLYEKVPSCLKGFVELVYDLNNNPSYRFFEYLLYKSEYYDKSSQSVVLWLTNNDKRPFVLSTPRLENENLLHLDIAFDHLGIDELGKMKRIPKPLGEIKKLLGIDAENEDLFHTFFTTEAPPQYKSYSGDKIRMRYFGHACILVETKNTSILVDPLVSYYGIQTDVTHYSDVDLPDVIDYVLITHNHQDHILLETLLPLRNRIKNIVIPRGGRGALQDPNLKLMFNAIGFKNVIEIDEFEVIDFGDCVLTGIPFIGEHSDLNVATKICHHVRIDDFSILFVADSCNLEPKLYEYVHKEIGDVDVIFLGMECDGAPLTWLYGPLLSTELARDKDNSRRLAGSNYERGMALVEVFDPKEVYVYAMGQEPWLEFISSIKYTNESRPIIASNDLIKKCISKAMIAERLYGEKELFYERITSSYANC